MAAEPQFAGNLKQANASFEGDVRGCEEGWAAPAAITDAPNGFGDETWTVAQTETVIAWIIGGGEVRCELSGFSSRSSSSRELKFNLQVFGGTQRYSAKAAVRFGHFYIEPELLARVGEGLGLASFTLASLRDDLIMRTASSGST